MRVIVAQLGARHHYAIPRMLARAGNLEALYTDSCAQAGIGWLLDKLTPSGLRFGSIAKLLERQVTGVPWNNIRSTDCILYSTLMGARRGKGAFEQVIQADQEFSQVMTRWGVGSARIIYSMFGEGLDFLRLARQQGVKVAMDVFITPVAHRVIDEERKLFPAWEGASTGWDERLESRIRELLTTADLLVCPGENVVTGVQSFLKCGLERIALVPYGSGADFRGRVNQPVRGRVLFGGTAELRKGIHYFASAAKMLAGNGFEFVVAGSVTERIRRLPDCAKLKFLGRISRNQMVEELLRADVLVLPTLAEGSATVVSEAMAAGVPVITTRSAGSLIMDNVNGRLIPERNGHALAEAIEQLITDRTYRDALARGARDAARLLSEDAWSQRLFAELERLIVKAD